MDDRVIAVPPLDALPFAVLIRESHWLGAALQATHLLGMALLIGTVIAFDLRVLGVNRRLPVQHLGRHLLPISVTSLVLVVPSGLAMFAAHASELLTNRLFALKMSLIFLGAVNAIVFHTGPYRSVIDWNQGCRAPLAARACAGVSLLGWVAVLICGTLLNVWNT